MNGPRRGNRKITCVNNIRGYFKQYCAATSIHGFQYFGEERSVFERIWWLLVFGIILSCCSLMIYKIYEKYEDSPVIVTFATKETPIYKIPFPAVTICPEIKSVKAKFDFAKAAEKTNGTRNSIEDKYLQYLSPFCDLSKNLQINRDKTFTDDFFDALDEIKPDFFGNALKCNFMGVELDCEGLFVPILTDEGVCYSFNILGRSHIFKDIVVHYKDYHNIPVDEEWDMERGYFENAFIDVYPKRALLAGASNGLTIELSTLKRDLDYKCNAIQGFKVVLHTPARLPQLKQEYFRLPLDQAIIVAVQPSMITTSDKVKMFYPSKRNCYFPSEKNLKYFKAYSQMNCQLECLTNLTLLSCGCVNTFMPRDNATEICGNAQHGCMKMIDMFSQYAELFSKFPDDAYVRNITDVDFLQNWMCCDCLPLCTDLSYSTEISQVHWNWQTSPQFDKNLVHMSSLTVYFRVNHFIPSERQELYGPIDFIANFGGLLGLFTGFSILSLMEIVYFLTVKICCNIKMYGRWSGTIQ